MGFPLGTSPCGTPWWVGSIVNETRTFFMAYENITQAKTKNMKRPLTESEIDNETDENFYQFIILESIEETLITKLSPFLIQKTIETYCKPINIKNAMKNTIIIQTTNQKQSEKILKWKQFGKLNIKTYSHPTLNFSKRVIKSPDFALCFLEEIRPHLKPQVITDVKRISICKETRTIDTNTYILTFNKPTTLTSIRIGYINTKIETYIHILTVPDEYVTHNQNQEKTQSKEKIQIKQKTLINEPIPLSNRFSPMDIDPVETTTEDSDKTTIHIKTGTINLQKRLHKKINIKDNPTENETTNPTPKK